MGADMETASGTRGTDPARGAVRADSKTDPNADPTTASRQRQRSVASSPEALDVVVRTTTTGGWIALIAVCVAVVTGLVWAFVARVPQQTSGSAVVHQQGASVDVVAGSPGSVVVTVAPGQPVTAGQEVARLTPFDDAGAAAEPAVRSIRAPMAGTVRDVLVRDGLGVVAADVVAVVTPERSLAERHAVMFMTAEEADLYRPGQPVSLTVTNLGTQSTRTIAATVSAVGNVPSDIRAVEATLSDDGLARSWFDRTAGVPYRVDLEIEDLSTFEPLDRPAQGQIVEVTNTYAEPHPIELLFGSS
jgi:multidrug resistance efflux pump